MDVLPERQEYEAGETARFQVRMPFRRATALVTVEREGVIEVSLRELCGREPVVEVPMARRSTQRLRIGAGRARPGGARRAARGTRRSAGSEVTALVDLNKPAFRLGMASVRVGWKPHRLDVTVKPGARPMACASRPAWRCA